MRGGMGMPLKQKVILGVIGLAVVAMLFAFSREPGSGVVYNCPSKGIDPEQRKEGTCEDDGYQTVVVDRTHLLEIHTLDARIEGMRESDVIHGPGGTRHAKGRFVTFDLAVTNRTGRPQTVTKDQFQLNLEKIVGVDVGVEKADEPRSFLAWEAAIPPGATRRGTVTFDISEADAKILVKEGNLDVANFEHPGLKYAPEEPEAGVIRTYD